RKQWHGVRHGADTDVDRVSGVRIAATGRTRLRLRRYGVGRGLHRGAGLARRSGLPPLLCGMPQRGPARRRHCASAGRRRVLPALSAQQNTGAPVVPEQAIAPPPPLPLVTAKDLLDGLKNPGRWLTYSGDYTGQRHSPLTQITPANVARLSSQWTFQAEGMPVG